MTQTTSAFKPLRMSALVAASVLACATLQAAPLKIALVETLSGPASPTGQLFRSAARYSIDNMNASGGWNGEPIQMLEYDNQGGPAGAAEKVKAEGKSKPRLARHAVNQPMVDHWLDAMGDKNPIYVDEAAAKRG